MRPRRAMTHPAPAFALGIDAGGSAARWALADGRGAIVAEGEVPGFSGWALLGEGGRAAPGESLAAIVRTLPQRPDAACAGVTGLDGSQAATLGRLLASALGLADSAVRACSDIELLCRAAFAPGAGILLYAGTGSIAAHLRADGTLERAGGRGPLVDDAGSGHWIAREALQAVWRAEDEAPGAWRSSPLARALGARLGGHDWRQHREWLYGAGTRARGEFGQLALAVAEVAEVADRDPIAARILEQAGRELARLVHALTQRCGPQPIVRAGRVFALHPLVEQGLRAALPADIDLRPLATLPHHAAARLALQAGAADRAAGRA